MNIDMNKIKELQEYSKELKVLYVEDNEEARVSTIEVLYEFFEDITIALDGLEGLDKFNNSTFDLIISDINMPNMNGIAMTEEIRKTDKEIPILIVSAYSESGYFIETIKLGVEGYLLKPIELEQFIIMLSKTIEKIKMKKKIEEYQKSLENANIKLNQDIKNQLYIDHLTSLPNRLALERELFKRNEDYIAMYILDINNFRKINEMYGFDTGNEILNNISKNIKEYAKNKEFSIYKISADEFVLLRRYKDYNLEYLHKNTLDILKSLDNMKITINHLDNDIFLSITMGIAFNKRDVLTKASSALDLAKVKNKKFVLYDKTDKYYEELEQLFHWQRKIKNALDNDNIIPFFQPIYNKDKEIQKYEVLMRMKEKEENQTKYISPFFFLDISIKTKQYDQLSYRIISKAFDIAKNNRDKVFSINLGYRDMTNEDIKKLISDYSNARKINGEKCNLVFEIVESEDISDYDVITSFFQEIGCSNIKIAIDDFGSGYSNFSHILKIMPTYLKIDGSLIKDINTNENMKTLSKAIISFAKKLDIKTIAEFVHSKEIFEILQKEGVDEYQGFYLGEPSPTL